jgi:hypothetical protein
LGLNSGGELQESATYFDCCKVKHKNIFLLWIFTHQTHGLCWQITKFTISVWWN